MAKTNHSTKPRSGLARTLTGRLVLSDLRRQRRLALQEVARLRRELAGALRTLQLTDRAVAAIRAA